MSLRPTLLTSFRCFQLTPACCLNRHTLRMLSHRPARTHIHDLHMDTTPLWCLSSLEPCGACMCPVQGECIVISAICNKRLFNRSDTSWGGGGHKRPTIGHWPKNKWQPDTPVSGTQSPIQFLFDKNCNLQWCNLLKASLK